MENIKIVLIDDHQIVRDGIKELLKGISNINIIGEAKDGKELLQILKTIKPDLLVLDISLPDISGIDITRQIVKNYPDIKILILSMYTGENFITESLEAGARGYLPKNTTRKELLEAIYAIFNGKDYLSSSISEIIVNSYINMVKNKTTLQKTKNANLTKRESEILNLFGNSFKNREIADELYISVRTVEAHKRNIMKKFELRSSVDLVKFAIKNKIININ